MPTRLELAKQRLEKDKERVRALEAVERERERKRENKRSLLIGRAVQSAIAEGKFSGELLNELLDGFFDKPNERLFLGLPVSEIEAIANGKPSVNGSKSDSPEGEVERILQAEQPAEDPAPKKLLQEPSNTNWDKDFYE